MQENNNIDININNIRLYKDSDFKELSNIAYILWSCELEGKEEYKRFIYDLLIKYYLYNNNLTFVYEDNDKKIKGFSLASYYNETNNFKEFINENINKFTKEEQILIKGYINYLDYNHKVIDKYINNESIYFNLLTSIKHNVGKLLIDNLKKECIKNNIKYIYFWTDETCNYKYYEQKGFIKVYEYISKLYERELKTFIYCIKL